MDLARFVFWVLGLNPLHFSKIPFLTIDIRPFWKSDMIPWMESLMFMRETFIDSTSILNLSSLP